MDDCTQPDGALDLTRPGRSDPVILDADNVRAIPRYLPPVGVIARPVV